MFIARLKLLNNNHYFTLYYFMELIYIFSLIPHKKVLFSRGNIEVVSLKNMKKLDSSELRLLDMLLLTSYIRNDLLSEQYQHN